MIKKRFVLLSFLAIASIGVHFVIRSRQSNDIVEILDKMNVSSIISMSKIISEPPLFVVSSVRNWEFKIDVKQKQLLKSMCNDNSKLFPMNGLHDKNTCVASYYLNYEKSKYYTLLLVNNIAVVTELSMSNSDIDTLNLPVENQ